MPETVIKKVPAIIEISTIEGDSRQYLTIKLTSGENGIALQFNESVEQEIAGDFLMQLARDVLEEK